MRANDRAVELRAEPPTATVSGEQALSSRAFAQCAVIAAIVWCVLFYFARHTSYAGDDISVLRPLFDGGLWQSLHRYVRPLEYMAAWISFQAKFPLWLIVSCLAYVGTAIGTRALLTLATPARTDQVWMSFASACTPLAAQAYFQIDATSQALANVFAIALIVCTLKCVHATVADEIRRWSWRTLPLATLCVLAKETSYGVMLLASLLILARHRRQALVPAACIQLLLVCAVAWSLLNTYDIADTTSRYGPKLNPLYWLSGLGISMTMAATPVPTSILLSGALLRDEVLMVIAIAGLSIAALAWFAFLPKMQALPRLTTQIVRCWHASPFGVTTVMTLFLVASVVPSILLKAGELYASQMVPVLTVLLIKSSLHHSRMRLAYVWPLLCVGWLMASAVNVMYYSVATGYAPKRDGSQPALERRVYASIEHGVREAPYVYSIYAAGIYEFAYVEKVGRTCKVSAQQPDICLPATIGSGFPERL